MNVFQNYDDDVCNLFKRSGFSTVCGDLILEFTGSLWPLKYREWTEDAFNAWNLKIFSDNVIEVKHNANLTYHIASAKLFEDENGSGTEFWLCMKSVKLDSKTIEISMSGKVGISLKAYIGGMRENSLDFGQKEFFHKIKIQ